MVVVKSISSPDSSGNPFLGLMGSVVFEKVILKKIVTDSWK
jgi:hypothetical protein